MSSGDRVGNAIFSMLARAGTGPAHLLTTRGRKTGRPRTNPVVFAAHDKQRWLVAPYGPVSWVLNARAAGLVTLRRGHGSQDYPMRELPLAESGPVLKRYIRIAPATRPYFKVSKDLAGKRIHRRGGPPSGIRTQPFQRGPALAASGAQTATFAVAGTSRVCQDSSRAQSSGQMLPVWLAPAVCWNCSTAWRVGSS